METGKVEVINPKQELEVVPSSEVVGMNEDKVSAIIALADRIDALGKALDKIRNFVLGRALPGDWVEFKGKEDGDSKLELVGAGADRIAATVGISFVDWRDWKETFEDEKGRGYIWYYACTAVFQGRRIEGVVGRAGSRDKFFGKAHGSYKELSDINEADIRTAARRNTMKEAVKLMLGIRAIPRSAATALGLDLSRVRSVEFGSKKDGTSAPEGPQGSIITTIADVVIKREQKEAPGKKPYVLYSIKGTDGKAYDTFDKKIAEFAKEKKGQKAAIQFEPGKYGLTIIEIASAPVEAPKAEIGA